jgi:8-oxo-dGTP diphosphatase
MYKSQSGEAFLRSDAEAEFLAAYEPGQFAKPSVTADVVLIGIQDDALRTILVRRVHHPDLGRWALPGGFVRLDEDLDAAAARVLSEKAGIDNVYLEQLYTFGRPGRDPRMRIISVAYSALVPRTVLDAVAASETTRLFTITADPDMTVSESIAIRDDRGKRVATAFDHREIIATALTRLRGKLAYAPVGYEFLPERFTLFELQRVHEIILNARVNKDSFRRKMLASGELQRTGELQDVVDHRPAALFRRIHKES